MTNTDLAKLPRLVASSLCLVRKILDNIHREEKKLYSITLIVEEFPNKAMGTWQPRQLYVQELPHE